MHYEAGMMEPQITFRDIPPSDAIETRIRERAERLERFYEGIIGCHVVVEAPHRHQHKGTLYRVRIDLTVPGGELVVNRAPAEHHAHEDVYVAIRDAFDAAERRLEDYARRQRGQVKRHEPPPLGRVVRLFPEERYGFVETGDGREVYFHANSVLDEAFDRLEVGSEVRVAVAEGEGERGPQATTVALVGKHHPAVTGRP